ncbi:MULTISPECIES: hypothetical protein [Enterobacteriaceae]|nr:MULTISPECIES: hypothetical protein [Enterobacteriaceae]
MIDYINNTDKEYRSTTHPRRVACHGKHGCVEWPSITAGEDRE